MNTNCSLLNDYDSVAKKSMSAGTGAVAVVAVSDQMLGPICMFFMQDRWCRGSLTILLFGFKNPLVARLLRGLKANASPIVEKSLPSSCFGNASLVFFISDHTCLRLFIFLITNDLQLQKIPVIAM
ncbi:unnamed protein product [Lactuca saligna]|uniref:Uncharacterized protein n=1 Tax=Lactuca saligna TaxID=75948 RepID=A0AA35YNN9_LACSI|nr:unnamed protein product [Lactuca saligna]